MTPTSPRQQASRRNVRVVAFLLVLGLFAGGCTRGGAAPLGGVAALPDGPPPAGTTYAEPPDGRPTAPVFDLELPDGQVVDAATLWQDRAVVLSFVASWCTLCQRQQAELSAIAREYGDRVTFLGIAGDETPEDLQAFLREHDVPYAVGIDPTLDVWLRYGVEEPPLIAFVTRGGQLVRGHPGGLEGAAVREIIDEVLLAE